MPFISEDGSKNLYMYSPSSYIGISRRLTEPEDEKKLENAVKLLSLLFFGGGAGGLYHRADALRTQCAEQCRRTGGCPDL